MGCLLPRSLSEGITTLLDIEYYDQSRPYYRNEILLTKMLCEIIDSNIIYKAYTLGDNNMLINYLLNIVGTENDAITFLNLFKNDFSDDNDDIIDGKFSYTTEIEKLINQFDYYFYKKYGYKMENDIIMSNYVMSFLGSLPSKYIDQYIDRDYLNCNVLKKHYFNKGSEFYNNPCIMAKIPIDIEPEEREIFLERLRLQGPPRFNPDDDSYTIEISTNRRRLTEDEIEYKR